MGGTNTARRPNTGKPTGRKRRSPQGSRWRALLRALSLLRLPRPISFVLRAGFVVLFLGALGLVAAHIRLSAGPLSLKFLVAPIEQAINHELSGMTIKIGDAVMRRTDGWAGIEFQLADVRLQDGERQLIAQAPAAAVRLSRPALLQGRIAPERVDLIRPRLHLFFSADGGASLSFQRAGEGRFGADMAMRFIPDHAAA